jgi:hypothetical protein
VVITPHPPPLSDTHLFRYIKPHACGQLLCQLHTHTLTRPCCCCCCCSLLLDSLCLLLLLVACLSPLLLLSLLLLAER